MNLGPGGANQAMPTGPVVPGAGPIVWEPDFFVFFSSIVARIKDAADYLKAEGQQLGIEGAEIPPPSPTITDHHRPSSQISK